MTLNSTFSQDINGGIPIRLSRHKFPLFILDTNSRTYLFSSSTLSNVKFVTNLLLSEINLPSHIYKHYNNNKLVADKCMLNTHNQSFSAIFWKHLEFFEGKKRP